jgi:hypothetical protein
MNSQKFQSRWAVTVKKGSDKFMQKLVPKGTQNAMAIVCAGVLEWVTPSTTRTIVYKLRKFFSCR